MAKKQFHPVIAIHPLKATRGGSITVFSTVFNKAVLLSYAFSLDPYNPMVLYPSGPLNRTKVSGNV